MMYRLLIITLMFSAINVFAQDAVKRNIYYGNNAFVDGDYEKAAGYYLDAVDQSPLNFKANYNLANAYYRMNQHDKAIERMTTVVNLAPTSFDKAKAYHNIGNAQMMKQDWDAAIEAYKEALKLNPSDEETRYNLAYALEMKKKQEEQKQDQENSGEGGNDMGDNSDENNSDSEENGDSDNNSDSENQENSDNNNDQENQSSEGQNSDEKGEGQSYEAKLSKDQIKNILDSYYLREKELQNKMNKNKRVGYGSKQTKDW